MVSELLKKYIWLIRTFVRAGERGMSLTELEERWELRFGAGYPRRTFNNHRDAIEALFNVRIECDRSTNRYYIPATEDVSDENAASAWIINTFTINEMLSMSKERLSGRVSVEDIPSGQRWLTHIMEAMTDNSELKVSYRKYDSGNSSAYTLRPYALKEASRRWYLVAYCTERDSVRVYGLDRILSLEQTGRHFRMPADFDVDALFAASFGVYLSDERPVRILLRTSAKEAGYLRDLPIHPSQEEAGNDGERITFSIFVRPNESLIMELERLGSRIEVLEPLSIRTRLAEDAAQLLSLYAADCHPDTCRRWDEGPEKREDGPDK